MLAVDRASVGSDMFEIASLSPLRFASVAAAAAPSTTCPEPDSNEWRAIGPVRSFEVGMREPTQSERCGIGGAREA